MVIPTRVKEIIGLCPGAEQPICARCISDIDAVISLFLSSLNSMVEEVSNHHDVIVKHLDVDWKAYKELIKWQDVIVSAAAVHRVHKPANSVLTQLKGLRVGKNGYVETWAISTDTIRPLSRKLGATTPGNHKKEYICEKLVEFRVGKDEDEANGIVVPNHIARSKRKKIWNIGRFINVLFSTEFKD